MENFKATRESLNRQKEKMTLKPEMTSGQWKVTSWRSHFRVSETQCVTGAENREREKRSDEQIRADVFSQMVHSRRLAFHSGPSEIA